MILIVHYTNIEDNKNMSDNIKNMAEHYTLEEIKILKSMLDNVEKKKKQHLGNSTNIYKFSQEYKKYIKITFSSKYLNSVNISFKHLIKYFGENKNLDEITVKEIEEFKYHIMNSAPKGFVVYMRTLKAALNIAIEWKYILSNPFVKVKFKKGQKKKPIFITRDDLEKILIQTENKKMKDIFIFAFNTGCRLGEITRLRWQNIDLRKNIIIIGDNLFTTKNEKQRIIPISKELLPILKELGKKTKKAQNFVFGKTNTFPFHNDYVSRNFKKACRKAKMKDEIHFHTLRHSFASNLAIKGVPIIVIKELLGHSSITTTEIYSHTNIEALQNAVKKLKVA